MRSFRAKSVRSVFTLVLGWAAMNPMAHADGSWRVVNDTVMGGVSRSVVRDHSEGGVSFSGDLSLENNGGFTSVRQTRNDEDWSEATGIELRVRGDGRSYIATVRLENNRRSRVYYRANFDTRAGAETTHIIPFEDFAPYAYGTPVPAATPLAVVAERIGTIGIMLADGRPGAFELHIRSMEPTNEPSEVVREARSPATVNQVFVAAIQEGVPLFNQGDAARCADIYQTAIATVLLLAPEDLDDTRARLLEDSLRSARRSSDPVERAWILRHAMDRML